MTKEEPYQIRYCLARSQRLTKSTYSKWRAFLLSLLRVLLHTILSKASKSNHHRRLLGAKYPRWPDEVLSHKNKSLCSHGNRFKHILCLPLVQLIAGRQVYMEYGGADLLGRLRGPWDLRSLISCAVITVCHVRSWLSMRFSKFLIWFLMFRERLIGFLILD